MEFANRCWRANATPSWSSRVPAPPIPSSTSAAAPVGSRRCYARASHGSAGRTRPPRFSRSRAAGSTRGVQASLETLDLGRKFDLIVCCGVFDFVEDAAAGLDAIRRHLAPQGRAIVSAASVSAIGVGYALVRRAQGVRVRLYTSRRLRALAASCGLRCTAARRLPGGSVAVMLEHAEPGV